jgi:hypothetical protein
MLKKFLLFAAPLMGIIVNTYQDLRMSREAEKNEI